MPRAVRRVRRWSRLALGPALRGAPVSDPLSGMRAYRIIVLKKALREMDDDQSFLRAEGWASSVELLGRLAPHARRIEETPLAPRYELQTRPSRLRWFPTLVSLFRLRGSRWWDGPKAEAT